MTKSYNYQTFPCPICSTNTKHARGVYRSKLHIVRRRYCPKCGHRIKTVQDYYPENSPEILVPSDPARSFAPNAKLTPSDVQDIRRLISVFRAKDLALQYDVHVSTIWDILSKRKWKHVPDTPN